MKTAEDYWYEYSHESIVEGLRAITEANFKQAIRLCQQDTMSLDTIKLIEQIEYQNKAAKEDHDKIKKLEFELKQVHNKAIDDAIALLKDRGWSEDDYNGKILFRILSEVKH